MANAFAAYLPHFRVEPPGGIGLGAVRPLGSEVAAAAPDPERAALARARQEGEAEARAQLERMRADDLAAHARELAERERRFAETTADVLAARLTAGIAEIETRLAAQVARVLGRFLEDAVRERAVAELSETVDALLAAEGAARLTITGPERLTTRLAGRLDQTKTAVTLIAAPDAAEVTATVDDTLVETRIGAWIERVRGATGGGADV